MGKDRTGAKALIKGKRKNLIKTVKKIKKYFVDGYRAGLF